MKAKLLFFMLMLGFCSAAVRAQDVCRPPEIVFNKNAYNIFDETQETYLGEAIAETLEKEYRVIKDDEANRYVRQIGEKLVKHLPPTNLKFQFHVVDWPTVNAFATAGGRIYVTRKLIAFVRNEDELAGIIGHELGHGIVKHTATDLSKLFREILKVEKVGDRKDVFDKYNQLIDRRNTKRVKFRGSHEDDQQLEADRIGLFAMTAAGYDPKFFASVWDRMVETKGNAGNSFSDFFGMLRPEQKRLREMLKAASSVPAACLDKKSTASGEDFEKWQSFVVATSSFQRPEKIKALINKKPLSPYLRGDIKHFQFSSDGNYVLAQDDSGVNVLKREPFSFIFRIEATEAKPANFSPDSKHISFSNYGLRVEKWSIAEKKAVSSREIHARDGCLQSNLSPDGKHLICYSIPGNLDVFSVETNEKIFTKTKFYEPTFFEAMRWLINLRYVKELELFQMEFSPDSRYVLAARVVRANMADSVDTFFGSLYFPFGNLNRDAHIGYDLQANKELKLSAEMKSVISKPYAFYSNDRIIGQHQSSPEKSGIFSFPDGERVEKFYLNANSYTKPHQGNYIFVRPTSTNPVGVYDLESKKFIAANKTAALDGYGDYFVSEGKDGVVDLLKFDKTSQKMQDFASLKLPKNNFGEIQTLSLSPDFEWLALSERSRGAVWNLKSGEMKIYIRGFAGSYFDTDGGMYADFPRFEKEPRMIGMMNPVTNVAGSLGELKTVNIKQHGKFLVRMKTDYDEELEKKAEKNPEEAEKHQSKDKDSKIPSITFTNRRINDIYPREGTLEVKDVRSQKLIWSKNFPKEIPEYKFDANSETVALYWPLMTDAARNEISKSPDLTEKQKSLKNRRGDYLVQILDSNTGNLLSHTLIETGEGSFRIKEMFAVGDWLTIIDTENRVLVYSLGKDELLWHFFGDNAAINQAKSIIAIENSDGQFSIYDLNTGQKIDELQFPAAVTYAAFSKNGDKLFVLTAEQNYYLFNADNLAVRTKVETASASNEK